MKPFPLLAAGLLCALVIVIGEAVLNFGPLAGDWAEVFARFALPEPGAIVAAQGLLKLTLLGVFTMWLALTFRASFPSPHRAALAAGLCVWFLVWAWVQWGMLLAGYVTPRIAAWTVAWGLFELPLAAWVGMMAYRRLAPATGRD